MTKIKLGRKLVPFRAESGHHLCTVSLALYIGPNHTYITLTLV